MGFIGVSVSISAAGLDPSALHQHPTAGQQQGPQCSAALLPWANPNSRGQLIAVGCCIDMERYYRGIICCDGFPSRKALQQLGQLQGLQGSNSMAQGNPNAIRGKGLACWIKGSYYRLIMFWDQLQGFGAGEHPAQAQTIPQPITISGQQFNRWGGIF